MTMKACFEALMGGFKDSLVNRRCVIVQGKYCFIPNDQLYERHLTKIEVFVAPSPQDKLAESRKDAYASRKAT